MPPGDIRSATVARQNLTGSYQSQSIWANEAEDAELQNVAGTRGLPHRPLDPPKFLEGQVGQPIANDAPGDGMEPVDGYPVKGEVNQIHGPARSRIRSGGT